MSNLPMSRRDRIAAKLQNKFEFDPEAYAYLSKYFPTRGDDAGAPDWWLVRKLQNGAGDGITITDLLEDALLYREHKPRGGQIQLRTCGTLNIVSENGRMAFWKALDAILVESGFYILIYQLALYSRITTTVAHTVSAEKSYTPDDLRDLHRKFLSAVTAFMKNRAMTVIARHIMEEHEFVLSIMEERSFARKVVDLSGGEDPIDLIMELPEMKIWKTAFFTSDAITKALEALGSYDDTVPYREQMERFIKPAGSFYTAMVNLAEAANLQYRIAFDPTKGLAEVVTVFEETLSRRSNSGSSSGGTESNQQPKHGSKFNIPGHLDKTLTRELRSILASLFSDIADMKRLATDSTVGTANVTFGNALNSADSLLEQAGKSGLIGNVLEIALSEYPNNRELNSFVSKL